MYKVEVYVSQGHIPITSDGRGSMGLTTRFDTVVAGGRTTVVAKTMRRWILLGKTNSKEVHFYRVGVSMITGGDQQSKSTTACAQCEI